MTYALGKKPAAPLGRKAIKFRDVFNMTKLPTPPTEFGNQELIRNWTMLGNDEYGDCVWAAKAHMHMLWSKMGQHILDRFSTFNVLSDYSAQTGFAASDPNTDQGTDMKEAAEYHRKIGVIDRSQARRQVSSYVHNQPGNLDQIAVSAYIFGAVEIGVILSNENMDQFDKGVSWTVVGTPVGGHCIPIIGRDGNGDFIIVSWGGIGKVTPAFLQKNMDEGITYLSNQTLNSKGISGGFNRTALDQMLAQISPQVVAANEPPQEERIRYAAASMADAKQPTTKQYDIAFKMLRAGVDRAGFGFVLGDDKLRPLSEEVCEGIVATGDDDA